MDFIVKNWVLIAVALTSGGLLLWPLVRGAASGGLGTTAAVQLINREKGIVVDVSEPDEYAAAHVAGARSVPLGQLEKRLPEVVKNKALPVIMVCATGVRASRAVGIAQKLGYDKAQALQGGLRAWKDANLPIEKA